jgi:hypothetical protein
MRAAKRVFSWWTLLLLILAITLVACLESPPSEPRVVRIEVAPAAVLLTAAGQSHVFTARAFDQNGQPIQASFTWASTKPNNVSVSSSGEAQALVDVGSAQITASTANVTSVGMSVVVAEPVPGAVLVTDAQVLAGPERLDPASPPLGLGIRSKLTVTGVSGIAPGTILLASESKPIGGRVVSVTDAGDGKQDVILESVALPDLLSRYSFESSYTMQNEYSASENLVQPNDKGSPLKGKFEPLKCKSEGLPTLGDIKFTYTPPKLDLNAETRLDESVFKIKLTGTVSSTLKATLCLAGMIEAKLTCKLQLDRITLPIFGFLSVLIAPEVPIGFQLKVNLKLLTPSVEIGVETKTTTKIIAGFDCNLQVGLCDSLNDFDSKSETKPIFNISKSEKYFRLESEFGVYAYLGLNLGSKGGEAFGVIEKPFSIFEANLGPRLDGKFAASDDQASDPAYASNYVAKIYGELGFASDAREAIESVLKKTVSFKARIVFERPFSRSPIGTGKVDKAKVKVGEDANFTIKLDPKYLDFIGFGFNVDRVEIYRVPPGKTGIEEKPIGVVYPGGNSSEYTWKWTPTSADRGKNKFYVFVVTKFYDLPLEITENSELEVTVGDADVSPGKFNATTSYAKVGSTEAYDIKFSISAKLEYKDNLVGKGYEAIEGFMNVGAYTVTRTGGKKTASGEFHYKEVCETEAAAYKITFFTPGDRHPFQLSDDETNYTVSFSVGRLSNDTTDRGPNTKCTQTYDNGVVKTRTETRYETPKFVASEPGSNTLKVFPILTPGNLVGEASHTVKFEGSGDLVTYSSSWNYP